MFHFVVAAVLVVAAVAAATGWQNPFGYRGAF